MWLPLWYKYVRGVSNDPIPLSLPLSLFLALSSPDSRCRAQTNSAMVFKQAGWIGDCVVLARDLDGCGQRSVVVVDEVGPNDIKTSILILFVCTAFGARLVLLIQWWKFHARSWQC